MATFKKIPDFENYEISELGLVRNVKTKMVIKTEQGGRAVRLSKDGKQQSVSIIELKKTLFTDEKAESTPSKPKAEKAKKTSQLSREKNKDKIKALIAEGKTRSEVRKLLGVKSISYALK